MATLEAIKYAPGSLELLDQRLLPTQTVFLPVPTTAVAYDHIKDMVVRGAPAIGVTAALSMAVELQRKQASKQPLTSADDVAAFVEAALAHLVTSRPTAVNLADACNNLQAAVEAAAAAEDATAATVVAAVVAAAEAYHAQDLSINTAIGKHGAAALLKATGKSSGLRVMTCCNTGSLATSGYGTALGVVRALHADGKLEHVFATETRPYNQGSRLTAYELVYENIPGTLICDSMAAYKMSLGEVDAIVVGADRVTANGDTANKIGTYALAVHAQHFGIPFFVAAPVTSIDVSMATGASIPIEQRSPTEITHSFGHQVAATGINVWNPAFDVTPGYLVTGVVTEHGVAYRANAKLDVAAFLRATSEGTNFTLPSLATLSECTDSVMQMFTAMPAWWPASRTFVPGVFVELNDPTLLVAYIASDPEVAAFLGGEPDTWTTREVGDGNINFVYIVQGQSDAIVVKQALPYVRCVGESWPLTPDRARLEAEALMEGASHCPTNVPKVWKYDDIMKTIWMRYIEPPHIILRKGLCQAIQYPSLAEHVGEFMAATLFNTSRLHLTDEQFRAAAAKHINPAMCAITEQVIFDEPYGVADNNKHNPLLEPLVLKLRKDVAAKLAISALKAKFVGTQQAFLHGDLHTGSLMCTPSSTLVIDPEFAFYGPIGFDVGSFLANLLFAYFAQDGHATKEQPRDAYAAWLLSTFTATWAAFETKLLARWDARVASGEPMAAYPGLLFGPNVEGGKEAAAAAQKAFMAGVKADTLGFMGCEMIRRVVGIAHVEDLESIADEKLRAQCEARVLRLGRELLVHATAGFSDVAAVAAAAQKERKVRL